MINIMESGNYYEIKLFKDGSPILLQFHINERLYSIKFIFSI